MNSLIQIAFNLFFNTAFSFLAGLGIIWLALKLFRVRPDGWKLFLLSLPFVKIFWDLAMRGIPAASILRAGLDPLTMPPHSQSFSIGVGFTKFGPLLHLFLTADAPNGKQYTTSVGDYLFALSHKHLGSAVPAAILAGSVFVSLVLLGRRVWRAFQFEAMRKTSRKSSHFLTAVPIGLCTVDIYTSETFQGTPFTGGVFKPYICLPQDTYEILSSGERQAVIQHELGHIRQWDLLGTFLIQGLGDLLWFIPGYRLLGRKIDRLREILADQSAVRAGVSPAYLASALLRLQNIPGGQNQAVLYSAFFREKSLLKQRIDKLVGRESLPGRLGWNYLIPRILITAWTDGAVMITTLGGNHETSMRRVSSWVEILPSGLSHALTEMGFG